MSSHDISIPGLTPQAEALVMRAGAAIKAPVGMRVFEPGKPAEQFYLLTNGVIKVQITAESGREIVLYRVGPGDACVMTVSCLIGQGLYNGEGLVEQDVSGYAIGLNAFNQLMASCAHFRATIMEAYSVRFLDIVRTLEDVAFRPLEARLAARLLQLTEGQNQQQGQGPINSTHQFLATDLGSAREVISRQLKGWETSGFVQLGRGTINLTNIAALQDIANRR